MERWELLHRASNLDMLQQTYLSDWTVARGKAKYLTDFAGGGKYVVVSDRAKVFIEKHDIGHSQFVPLHVFERPDMTPVDGLWHYWILNRGFDVEKEAEEKLKRLRTSARMDLDVAWEVANNPIFRAYISKLPFWCRWADGGAIAIRKDVFIAMKDAGLTSLIETTSDSIIVRQPNETVGHLM